MTTSPTNKGSNTMLATTTNTQYVTLGQACRFLEAHGSVNHMVATADGLLVTAWVKDCKTVWLTSVDRPTVCASHGGDVDDQWFEEMHVFPIVNNNRVDLGAIRAYLGY